MVTDYPFDDIATVVVISPAPVPVYLRIPGWANNASINVNGENNYYPTNGTMYKVSRNQYTYALRCFISPVWNWHVVYVLYDVSRVWDCGK